MGSELKSKEVSLVRKRSSGSNSTTLGTKAGRKEKSHEIKGLIHTWLCTLVACRQWPWEGRRTTGMYGQVTFSVRVPKVKHLQFFFFLLSCFF